MPTFRLSFWQPCRLRLTSDSLSTCNVRKSHLHSVFPKIHTIHGFASSKCSASFWQNNTVFTRVMNLHSFFFFPEKLTSIKGRVHYVEEKKVKKVITAKISHDGIKKTVQLLLAFNLVAGLQSLYSRSSLSPKENCPCFGPRNAQRRFFVAQSCTCSFHTAKTPAVRKQRAKGLSATLFRPPFAHDWCPGACSAAMQIAHAQANVHR